jgi:Nucleotide modification associated domain 1
MKNINWEDHTLEPLIFDKPSINKDSISLECENLSWVLAAKNHDYGNSVQEQFDEYGLTSILIRLDDKMRRLKNLLSKPQQVSDESILDTLQDMAGYAVLGRMCLQIEQEKKNNKPVLKKPGYMDLDDF